MKHSRVSEQTTPTVIFLHLPKTAGSSLNAEIERQYAAADRYEFSNARPQVRYRDFERLPETQRGSFRLIAGHMPFGIHRQIPRPCEYFTVLRHPVERVVSLYYQILRLPAHRLHRRLTTEVLSLANFVDSRLTAEVDNHQTRLLSGVPGAVGQLAPDGTLLLPEIAPGGADRRLLDQASRNLERHFPIAGTTERLSETLLLLRRRYGWNWPRLEQRNVATNRPTANLTVDLRRRIEDLNRLDLELYRRVDEGLDRATAAVGLPLQLERLGLAARQQLVRGRKRLRAVLPSGIARRSNSRGEAPATANRTKEALR